MYLHINIRVHLFNSYYTQLYRESVIDLPPQLQHQPPAIVQHVGSQARPGGYYNAQKQYDTIIACLILEAGGEGKKGMEAVYEVIRNRSFKKYKNTSIDSMYKIVTAPKQFSCFNSSVEQGVSRAKKHPRWNIATEIVTAPVTNHTQGATFYHTLKVNPYWANIYKQQGAKTVVIGNHIFYTIK